MRAARIDNAFEEFKKEAEVKKLRAKTDNKWVKVVKWRGETLMTGSLREAFYKVKDRIVKPAN